MIIITLINVTCFFSCRLRIFLKEIYYRSIKKKHLIFCEEYYRSAKNQKDFEKNLDRDIKYLLSDIEYINKVL